MHFRDERPSGHISTVRTSQCNALSVGLQSTSTCESLKILLLPRKKHRSLMHLSLNAHECMIRALNLLPPSRDPGGVLRMYRVERRAVTVSLTHSSQNGDLRIMRNCIWPHPTWTWRHLSCSKNYFRPPCRVVAKNISRRGVSFDQTARRSALWFGPHAELYVGAEKCLVGLAKLDFPHFWAI